VAVAGDRRAFDELVRRYQSPVRRFFLHQTLGDRHLSDDLAQDTFIKAYTGIASFRGLASFQTWLMRIAYNVFYDHARRKQGAAMADGLAAEVSAVERVAADESMPSASRSALGIDLYGALQLLKEEERACITLQLVEGYDIAAISRITQMKEGTVKSHLSRGKEKMANYLRKNGYNGR